MLFFEKTTGIEVGETDLTIALVRNTFGKTRLVGIYRLADFIALNEEERRKTLQQFLKTHRVPAASVYLSLPKDQGIVRQIQLPVEVKRKLPEVVKLQVETLSPWPAAEIYWDFASETPKKDQSLMTVTIVMIPRLQLDPWIVFFKSMGLPLSGAAMSSVAQGHGIAALWNDARPTIVLRREASYTEGIVINGNQLAAITGPSADDDPAPRSVIDRLVSVGKVSSSADSRLIVCGKIESSAFQNNPAIPLEDAKPEAAIDFGAIAAALLPLKQSPFKANLVPAELRYRESRRRLIPAFVLGVLAVIMGGALSLREPYQNAIYASQLDTEIRKISPKVKEVADQEKELDQLSQRYRAMSTQLLSRDRVLETMGELTRVLPPPTFLTSYAYQDGTITISGLAARASEIQNILEGSPVFKGVEFANSVTRDPAGKDRFTLKMVLEEQK